MMLQSWKYSLQCNEKGDSHGCKRKMPKRPNENGRWAGAQYHRQRFQK
jgi:hypothetical protein